MENILRSLVGSAERILILSHINADPDAIGSSIAVYKYLESLGKEPRMAAASGVNALGRNLIKKLRFKIEVNPSLDGLDAILVLDASSLSNLLPVDLGSFKGEIYAIDHHIPEEEFGELCKAYYSDEESTSTSELVYDMLKDLDFKFTKDVCLALITGIVTDTAHLQFARPSTLRTIAALLELAKMDYPDVLRFISIPTEPSRKIAHLKAASRVEVEQLGEWVLALSHVSSFEASSARALVKIGADVAFVASKKKEDIRISVRASNNFVKKTGVNFARDVVPVLTETFGGSGGGHIAAASVNGRSSESEAEVLSTCRDILEAELKKRKPL